MRRREPRIILAIAANLLDGKTEKVDPKKIANDLRDLSSDITFIGAYMPEQHFNILRPSVRKAMEQIGKEKG